VLHALCAISGQAPEDRATNQYGARAQGESLEDAGATTDAAIQIYLTTPGDSVDNLRQSLDTRHGAIELATSVNS